MTARKLREVEMDCAHRNDEDGFLRDIITRAKMFAARMAFHVHATKATANNRRKFGEAIDDYVAATGLAIAM